MPKLFASFSPVVRLLFTLTCLSLCLSCQSAAERDKQLLAEDKEATVQLNQINAEINTTRAISPENFAVLKNLHAKYPNSADVRQAYKAALLLRDDSAALEKLLTEIPVAELSREDRLALAKVYVKLGKYESALETAKPLTEISPPDTEAKILLGHVFFNLGRFDEAGKQYDDIWETIVREKRVEEIANRGNIFFRQNNLPKAVETLQKALAINPEHVAANNTLSRIYAQQGDLQQAEFYRAKTSKVHDTTTANTLQASRMVQKIYQLEDAWKARRFEEVIELAQEMLPTSTEKNQKMVLYQYLFEAYKASGRQSEAQNALAEIQKLQRQK